MRKVLRIYSKANVNDLNFVLGNIIKVIKRSNLSSDTYLMLVTDKVVYLYDSLTGAINRDTLKSELNVMDFRRDNTLRAFYYVIKGLTFSDNEAERKAADIVFSVLDRYGLEIISQSYKDQTVSMDSLIKDLQSADIAAIINGDLAHTAKYFNAMISVTEEWKDSVSENIIKQTEHKKEMSASKLLPEIRNKVNKELLAYVEVMAIADVTQYGALYEELTTVVDDINRVISNRKTGSVDTKE